MLPAPMIDTNEALNDLSDYFHGAPIGLHVAGPDGTITRTNLAELELLGYSSWEDEYVGHHLAEFHADADGVRTLLDRLIAGETVAEHETTLLRRDGKPQRVLLYANARLDGGDFRGVRCLTFPHPDDLRPDIAEVGALRDESIERRELNLTESERNDMYMELLDFFDNSPISLHIVGGDGLIKRASKAELAAMGCDRESYIGQHIASFHADQKVIDGMLEDLVGGTPLVNFGATLFRKDGSKLPVMIYSNSRMREGSFVNTRCLTVPVPKSLTAEETVEFSWPRNEDFGFTIPGRDAPASQSKPNPMTVALKYIASRKRPEESLGFLAQVSKIFSTDKSFGDMLQGALSLSVPYLADFAGVDVTTGHLSHAISANLRSRADELISLLSDGAPNNRFSFASVRSTGEVTACFDLAAISQGSNDLISGLLARGIRSLVIAPLTIRAQHVGTLTLLREATPSRRNFGAADQAMAEELARRISFAFEIERLSQRT